MRIPRILLAFLIGLLCLVVPIASSDVAQAADGTKSGVVHNFHSDSGWSIKGIPLKADCEGYAYYVGVKSGLYIDYSMKFEAACTAYNAVASGDGGSTIRLSGVNVAGSPCIVSGHSPETTSGAGTSWHEGASISLGRSLAPVADDELPGLDPSLGGVCKPTRISSDHTGLSGSAKDWSAPISLGAMPTFDARPNRTDTCPYGTPQSVKQTMEMVGSNPKYTYTVAFSPGALHNWLIVPVATGGGVSTLAGDVKLSSFGGSGNSLIPNPAAGQLTLSFSRTVGSTYPDPLGYTIYAQRNPTPDPLPMANGMRTGQTTGPLLGPQIDTTVTPNAYRFTTGVTNPSQCIFYFGPKLYDDADPLSATDEPFGPVGDISAGDGTDGLPTVDAPVAPPLGLDPTEPDEECHFDITDPGSWLSGGMCSAVGLLGRIMGTLGSILSTLAGIPQALIELVKTAFVPNPTTWGMAALKDQFSARPPGSIMMASVSGAQAAASSYGSAGCGSLIGMDIGSTHASVTCSGVRSVPGYTALYSLVQIGLVAMTGLGIFRLFAGAFSGNSGG